MGKELKLSKIEERKIELTVKCGGNEEFIKETTKKLKDLLQEVFNSENWKVETAPTMEGTAVVIASDRDGVFIDKFGGIMTISPYYIKTLQYSQASSPICRFCTNKIVPEDSDDVHREGGKITKLSCKAKGGWRNPFKERECASFKPISKKYECLNPPPMKEGDIRVVGGRF